MVAGVADHEVAVEHGVAHALAEVVEHDDPVTAPPELPDDVASDVAGAAGDEYVS